GNGYYNQYNNGGYNSGYYNGGYNRNPYAGGGFYIGGRIGWGY
ncbi:MAG: rSAM-associated Gly-rich repeat protein, partial [Bdellovibrionaceae bacterium]|nr:rSAM-associated Gly-rich repeat protein [Pseudobdellovibrionaceae bacterium]